MNGTASGATIRARVFATSVLALALSAPTVAFGQEWSEGYKVVYGDIACSMHGLSMRGEVSNSPYISPNGGSITTLTCNVPGKPKMSVPLVSGNFVSGFLETKTFGKIQIFFENSLTSSGWMMGMKNDDKEKLITFLKAGHQ